MPNPLIISRTQLAALRVIRAGTPSVTPEAERLVLVRGMEVSDTRLKAVHGRHVTLKLTADEAAYLYDQLGEVLARA